MEKIPLALIPAVTALLLKRLMRDAFAPAPFKRGARLRVIQPLVGQHFWDRGMASGASEVTLHPGDIVECLGREDSYDLTVRPLTSNIDAFIARAVPEKDRPYVERHNLLIHFLEKNLGSFFTAQPPHEGDR